MKNKLTIITLVFTIGTLIFIFYKAYNPNVMICDGKIEISKNYKDYLEKNGRIDSICFYSKKVINNEFNYLELLIDGDIQKEKDFFFDRAKIISQLINIADYEEFKLYFNSTSRENRFKIIFNLKSIDENNSLLLKINNTNQDYRLED